MQENNDKKPEKTEKAPKLKNDRWKWIRSKTFAKVASVVLAIICWFSVASSDNTKSFPQDITEVPINLDLEKEFFSQIGLSIIDISPIQVTAKVKGDRATISRLKPAQVTAKVVHDSAIDSPGEYEFKLEPMDDSINSMSSLYSVGRYEPSTIKIKLDKLETKVLPIELKLSGNTTIPEGFIKESENINPSKITITGPRVELEKVNRCILDVNLDKPLDRNLSEEYTVTLLDVNGEEIDPEKNHISIDNRQVQLIITVLKKAELPLKVELINLPRNIGEEEFLVTLSNYEVAVAGPAEAIDRQNEIVLDYIDIRDVGLKSSEFTYDIKLPDNFRNLDNIASVTASFDTSEWSEKEFTIPEENIKFLNAPKNFEFELITKYINNVKFTGDSQAIEELDTSGIIAEIDLSEKSLALGQYQYSVKLSAPSNGFVWATGEYNVVLKIDEVS